jgi:hypothetical protein
LRCLLVFLETAFARVVLLDLDTRLVYIIGHVPGGGVCSPATIVGNVDSGAVVHGREDVGRGDTGRRRKNAGGVDRVVVVGVIEVRWGPGVVVRVIVVSDRVVPVCECIIPFEVGIVTVIVLVVGKEIVGTVRPKSSKTIRKILVVNRINVVGRERFSSFRKSGIRILIQRIVNIGAILAECLTAIPIVIIYAVLISP